MSVEQEGRGERNKLGPGGIRAAAAVTAAVVAKAGEGGQVTLQQSLSLIHI